jgi:uncharacterized protein
LQKRGRRRLDRKALQILSGRIAEAAHVERTTVYVDASRVPSMPLTPSKEEMMSILVVDRENVRDVPISNMPLVESISGFFDMLRVYTTAGSREKVERSVKKVLGDQDILFMGGAN